MILQVFFLPKEQHMTAGAELGSFELGSTVILLMEKEPTEWKIQQGKAIQLGEPIAIFPQIG